MTTGSGGAVAGAWLGDLAVGDVRAAIVTAGLLAGQPPDPETTWRANFTEEGHDPWRASAAAPGWRVARDDPGLAMPRFVATAAELDRAVALAADPDAADRWCAGVKQRLGAGLQAPQALGEVEATEGALARLGRAVIERLGEHRTDIPGAAAPPTAPPRPSGGDPPSLLALRLTWLMLAIAAPDLVAPAVPRIGG